MLPIWEMHANIEGFSRLHHTPTLTVEQTTRSVMSLWIYPILNRVHALKCTDCYPQIGHCTVGGEDGGPTLPRRIRDVALTAKLTSGHEPWSFRT